MPAINSVSATMNSSIISVHVPDMPATDFPLQILNISNSSELLAKTESFGRGKQDAHEMAYRGHIKVKRDITQSPEDQTNDIGQYLEQTYPNETEKCLRAQRRRVADSTSLQLSTSRFSTDVIKLANTPFCQFVYQNPPPTTTPKPTTMCNWGSINGPIQGPWWWCREKN